MKLPIIYRKQAIPLVTPKLVYQPWGLKVRVTEGYSFVSPISIHYNFFLASLYIHQSKLKIYRAQRADVSTATEIVPQSHYKCLAQDGSAVWQPYIQHELKNFRTFSRIQQLFRTTTHLQAHYAQLLRLHPTPSQAQLFKPNPDSSSHKTNSDLTSNIWCPCKIMLM